MISGSYTSCRTKITSHLAEMCAVRLSYSFQHIIHISSRSLGSAASLARHVTELDARWIYKDYPNGKFRRRALVHSTPARVPEKLISVRRFMSRLSDFADPGFRDEPGGHNSRKLGRFISPDRGKSLSDELRGPGHRKSDVDFSMRQAA